MSTEPVPVPGEPDFANVERRPAPRLIVMSTPGRWHRAVVTRRNLQVALAVLWLLDATLQFQPFMFGKGFATQIIAPAATGQPDVVSAAVKWATSLILAHPVLWNMLFATGQVAIGAGLLFRRTAGPALVLSILWATGVWYMGEGLGELLGGTAVLLNGAPGAVALYGLIGLAAWPRLRPSPDSLLVEQARHDRARTRPALPDERPASWVPGAWAVLWLLFGLLRALPGNDSASALSSQLTAMARGAPAWLVSAQHRAASTAVNAGVWSVVAIVAVEVAIGLAALRPGVVRTGAAWAGIGVALMFWVIGQAFGGIPSGTGTDPNSGPLVALLGVALLGVGRTSPLRRRPAGRNRPPWRTGRATSGRGRQRTGWTGAGRIRTSRRRSTTSR